MSYLSFDEFKNYSKSDIDAATFDKVVSDAENVLDHITENHYTFNDLETDVEFRKEQFKKAVAAQVAYFAMLKVNNLNELSRMPQSYSVGRTSITNNYASSSDSDGSDSMIAEDAYLFLEPTGLMHRGVN